MALSIKNADTERLARELAAATGTSVTGAITQALRQGLREVGRSTEHRERLLAEGRRISADAAARWPAALRDVDHGDLLHDERGLPR